VGEVSGALIRAAHDGRLRLCLNFDGEHVDLEICRRVVELVGSRAVVAMTDRVDVGRLAGLPLERGPESELWYQATGLVAAGSSSVDRQMHTLRSIALDEPDVWRLAALNAAELMDSAVLGDVFSYVTPERERIHLGG